MPRKPRIFLPDIPNHIVQRGKNREPVFFDSEDYEFYLDRLGCAIKTHEARLHAYVLMTNHIHLLMSGEQSNTISLIMQSIGRHYVPYLNRKYNLSGSVWQGRFKSHLVDSGEYFLACMR